MPVSKKKAIRQHAIKRFNERVGVQFSRDLEQRLVGDIQGRKNGAEFVLKDTNRTSIWKVLVEEKDCFVVYDKNRKQIVTVLPRSTNSAYQEVIDKRNQA